MKAKRRKWKWSESAKRRNRERRELMKAKSAYELDNVVNVVKSVSKLSEREYVAFKDLLNGLKRI